MALHHDPSDMSSPPPGVVDDTEHFRSLREALKDATTPKTTARQHRRTTVRSRLVHLLHLDR
jgi:hypothetical protein